MFFLEKERVKGMGVSSLLDLFFCFPDCMLIYGSPNVFNSTSATSALYYY